MRPVYWLILMLFFSFSAFAVHNQPYHLKLLAVQENGEGYEGSEADLFLELKQGSGRVFLDTYPITKMDTQASTRFAKEIACSHFKLNCQKYDFIYTIKASSNIIGGPSAGAAVAALTTIAMLDLPQNEKVAITGTINSGAIIGPVGGVKQKLEAASRNGISTVLIPKGSGQQRVDEEERENEIENEREQERKNDTDVQNNSQPLQTNAPNSTDLINFSQQTLNLKIIEVMDLDEVIFQMTGVRLHQQQQTIVIDPAYQQTMQGLQQLICSRSEKIEQELAEKGVQLDSNVTESIKARKGRALNASTVQDYYSAASFCFGNNIELKSAYYQEEVLSNDAARQLFAILQQKVLALEQKLAEEKIETIGDLQAMMIVKERLKEVHEALKDFKDHAAALAPEQTAALLAYAEERYFSAVSWTQFLSMDGKKYVLDREHLKQSCQRKIAESEERIQYVGLFVGQDQVVAMEKKVGEAQKALDAQEYEVCLSTASQTKAEANTILSVLGLREEVVNDFIDSKRKAVERVIVENTADGIFPIMGYSYYQYAKALKDQDKLTALLYLEYALEMSDLQIYFLEEPQFMEKVQAGFGLRREWVLVGEGILIGIIMTVLVIVGRKIVKGRILRQKEEQKRLLKPVKTIIVGKAVKEKKK